ncbi:MAG: HAL/PAL/TAL family ammonia-lyase [Rhizobiaceae bacterium]
MGSIAIVTLDPTTIASPTLSDFEAVARNRAHVALSKDAWAVVDASRGVIETCIAQERIVYGVTTGFGPLANRSTPGNRTAELQKNLIYHLATGVGDPLPYHEARGLLFARLVSMLAGASGASRQLVQLIVSCLNAGLAPVVPEKGTVGASGDLTPLAHVALALMGEGSFFNEDGKMFPLKEAFALMDDKTYSLDGRDGLALVNGTSAMTAIAALSSRVMARFIDCALRTSAVHAEIFEALGEAWHPALGKLRPHPGQIAVHARLNQLIAGSKRIKTDRVAETKRPERDDAPEVIVSPQDPYTIRCVPQIIGAIVDSAAHHDEIVTRELHSVTDNPVFLDQAPYAIHGGNFFGQHVAFASDHLANAATMLAVLSERQIARVTDERLSGLPAFLQPFETGMHSGLMGAQVTATALLAEIRTRAIPASIQSIPTNANNQDVVSMGTIGARKCRDILSDLSSILAIQLLAVAQAIDIIGKDKGFSPEALKLYDAVRRQSAFVKSDRPLFNDIRTIAENLTLGNFLFD